MLDRYEQFPRRESIDWLVISLDPAFTANERSDWSAFTVWLIKRDACYLLDVTRIRVEYPTLVRRIDELITRWRPSMFVVEAVGGGLALYQELRKRYGLIVNCFSKLDDKVVRMETEALAIEQGHVYVPAEAEWLETFRDEVVSFPMGKNDDQIDSMSQFLRWRKARNWQIQHAPPS